MSLTMADANGQQIPHLATSFESNEDASVWTFHLPENAMWSDGTPMTADDLIFSYHLRLDPEFMTGSVSIGRQTGTLPAWVSSRAMMPLPMAMPIRIEGLKAARPAHLCHRAWMTPNAVLPIGTQHLYALPKHILGELTPEEFANHPYVTTNPDPVLGPLRLAHYEVDGYIELENATQNGGARSN